VREKIILLKNVDFFSKLQKNELNVVARYSEYYPYKKGEAIFEQGSCGDELYIIKEGEVVIRRSFGDRTTDLARFIEGESFGELDLLDETPRTVSAVAETDSVLLVFPMRDVSFRDVLQKHSEIFSRILHKLLIMIAGRIRSTNKLVSERTPWIEDLRKQLYVDKLTGLYNRTYLEEDLASLLPQMGERTSMVVIKPDHFKRINDSFGHDTGDRVLRMLAETVKSKLGSEDYGIRYRGDEFALLLPDTDMDSAARVGQEMRDAVGKMDISSVTEGKEIDLTASVGVATYPDHAQNIRGLIERSFNLMLEAWSSGGNRIVADSDAKAEQ
jgi:diguanylate cyclase (GGDEF)-like protein